MADTQFEIVDDLEVPAGAARTRSKGALTLALEGLNMGQAILYPTKRTVKQMYPSVSPKKFPGKRFKVWQKEDGVLAIKRIEPSAAAE